MAISRERLELLIARSPDIVVATDRKGRVVFYNDGAKKSLGYTAEEIAAWNAAQAGEWPQS